MGTYKAFTIIFDTVYPCLTGQSINSKQSEATSPTFEVNGNAIGFLVDAYISNKTTEPTDSSEMTKDGFSPFEKDTYVVEGQVKWILFKVNPDSIGSGEVNTLNLIKT